MSRADSIAASAIFWGSVLIAAVIALAVIVWLVRRWALSPPTRGGEGIWSLQHLRELKAQGRITEGEFEALKAKTLSASRSSIRQTNGATSADDRGSR